MSAFDRKIWRVKPPPGTKLVGGHFAPNRLACPLNEYGGLVINNYVGSPFSAPITGVVTGTTSKTDRRDGRYHSHTGTDGRVKFAYVLDTGHNEDFLPSGTGANVTVLIGYRKRDTTARAATCFGADDTTGVQYRLGANVPYSDGIVYWDFENTSSGRVTYSGATFGDDIWAFTVGARGNEIWQNGTKRASGSYTGGRTAQPEEGWNLGWGNGVSASDLADFNFVYMWDYQLPIPLIKELSINPWKIWTPYKVRFVSGFSNTLNLTESVSDSFTFTDEVDLSVPFTLSFIDGFNFTEEFQFTNLAEFGVLIEDSLVLSDSVFPLQEIPFTVSINDSFQWADPQIDLVTGGSINVIINDGFTLADAAVVLEIINGQINVSVSDNLSLSDSVTDTIGIVETITDSRSLSDSLSEGLGILIADLADEFNFLDSASPAFILGVAVGDGFNLSDSLGSNEIGILRFISNDSFVFTDSVKPFSQLFSTFTDDFSLSDAVTIVLNRSGLSLNDSFTFLDVADYSLEAFDTESLSDTFGFQDSVAVKLSTSFIGYIRRYLNDVV